jgi:hypothetical protein
MYDFFCFAWAESGRPEILIHSTFIASAATGC